MHHVQPAHVRDRAARAGLHVGDDAAAAADVGEGTRGSTRAGVRARASRDEPLGRRRVSIRNQELETVCAASAEATPGLGEEDIPF